MKQILNSDVNFEKLTADSSESPKWLPSGWWILPSAALGLAGWIGIFHLLGIL